MLCDTVLTYEVILQVMYETNILNFCTALYYASYHGVLLIHYLGVVCPK